MAKKLFQYAVILHPKKKDEQEKVLVEPSTVLADEINSVTLVAARAIPAEYVDRLDEIEVVVRPF